MGKRNDRVGGGQTTARKQTPAHAEIDGAPTTKKSSKSLSGRRDNADLYYDQTVITPAWTKISSTPWTAMAIACGGYGRMVDGASVSHDCPPWMHIPTVMTHKPNIKSGGEFGGHEKSHSLKPGHSPRTKFSISDEAPEWFKHANRAPQGKRYGHTKMVLGKTVIFEPNIREPTQRDIDWGGGESYDATASSRRQESARSARVDSARLESARKGSCTRVESE
jgi:hypothetical protein